MTALPPPSKKKLGLVIDLDTCVGCHACAVACKEWNDGGQFGPLPDSDPYGADPDGVWFNRVHTYEVIPLPSREAGTLNATQMVYFPRSCLHCETPDCVTVCPTGASYKRAEDGIVLVDADKCIGCQLCAWACPYGAREISEQRGTMQKCT
nr:4Fe-4S dicluster domain-containing protein [Pseudomonadota bacterium]